MPIGAFEREVLRLLAANRNPDSFVGGATVLHQSPDSPRSSRDVDLFHDAIESLSASAQADVRVLQQAGFTIELEPEHQTFRRAVIRRGNQQTKIEWVLDSAFRFFPVGPDDELGWRLNFWDAATNKVLALAGRSEIRDLIDVLYLHERHLHLGALTWAAAGKDPGFTPESIINWMRRHSVFRPEDLAAIVTNEPLSLNVLKEKWLNASETALELIRCLPLEDAGCLYLDSNGRPVLPEPSAADFKKLKCHFGSLKGAWPRIPSA
jgi:hypothetical protein